MKLAIMQPYFLPYIGYWQLLSAVDVFVVYDNVQYTKKGWINRNRFLLNGSDRLFTLQLKRDSDGLDVRCRSLAEDFKRERLIAQLEGAYRKAPYFRAAFPIINEIIRCEHENLFDYIANSIRVIADYLGIKTPLVVSSTVSIDHTLRAENKVLALCKSLGADRYINAIGGQSLYHQEEFAACGIELSFLQTRPIRYQQFGNPFVPNLSIVDVLMFNDHAAVYDMLGQYDLL